MDYEQIYLKAPTAGLLISPRNRILNANEEFMQLTNTKRDIIGKDIWDVFPANPQDPDAEVQRMLYNNLIADAITAGRVGVSFKSRFDIKNKAGVYEERYWETGMYPIYEKNGQLMCIYNKVVDVTNMVRMETLIARAGDVLFNFLEKGK